MKYAPIVLLTLASSAFAQPCGPRLLPQGAIPSLNNLVNAITIHNGSLFAAGQFTLAGSTSVPRIARLDPAGWIDVGSPFTTGAVLDIESVTNPDGSSVLWAVGNGTVSAAFFNGSTWTVVLPPPNVSSIREVMSYDDGLGIAIYVTTLQGPIFKWNGSSWSNPYLALLQSGSYSGGLVTFDPDGDGPAPTRLVSGTNNSSLFANTQAPPNLLISGLAFRQGQTWSASPYSFAWVKFVRSIDLGTGPKLYVSHHPGVNVPPGNSGLAIWDGTTWSGLPHTAFLPNVIHSAAALDHDRDGQRSLFGFSTTAIVGSSTLVRHDGTAWLGEASIPGLSDTSRRPRMIAGTDPCNGADVLFVAPLTGSLARIYEYSTCPRCPADLNQNNAADIADIFALLSHWTNSELCGDYNRDGTFLVQDIYDFLTDWTSGCTP
jgi:hypothetical protein